MKNFAVLIALLGTSAAAFAQSTHMMMPEGTRDIYLSVGAAYGPTTEGSREKRLFAAPLISAQWSNGVFVDMNTIGMHLSEESNLQYGPVFTPTTSVVTTFGADGARKKKRITPELGGFLNYSLGHGVGFTSSLMYGGSSDHRGMRLTLGSHFYVPVVPHHTVGLNAQVRLANRSALVANFAVPGVYDVHAGVRDVGASASWRWEISNKYSLSTSLAYSRLLGSAGASPRVERAGASSVVTVLTYRY